MGADPAAAIERLAARLGQRLIVQIREKDLGGAALLEFAARAADVCRGHGAEVIINHRLDVARVLDVGVQLPESAVTVADARRLLGTSATIGASRHDRDGVTRALADGASHATLAPIFATPGKGPALGIDILRGCPPRTFALGGIGPEHVAEVRGLSIAGVAAIRAAWDDRWAALADAIVF